MKVLKRWHDLDVAYLGETLRLQVRAIDALEAPAFLGQMFKMGENLAKGGDDDALSGLFGLLPEKFARESMAAFVRVAPGEEIQLEEGGPVKTGDQLYEAIGGLAAGELVIIRILREVQRYAGLSAFEGKDFGLPSTSLSAPPAETTSGPSGVQPTVPANGQPPSTATPSPAESESSFAPV